MRADLTRFGVEEARTPEDVDKMIASGGTVMMIVNSICGCAAASPAGGRDGIAARGETGQVGHRVRRRR